MKVILKETTRLADKFYGPLEQAIKESEFWLFENDVGDEDINEVWGDWYDQTDAAAVLGQNLTKFFKQRLDFPAIIVARTPDPDSNPDTIIGPQHPRYPNDLVLGGEMGLTSSGQLLILLNLGTYDEDFDVDDINPAQLSKKTATIIRHELVHAHQYIKRAQRQKISRRSAKDAFEREGAFGGETTRSYLSSYMEVDAYALEIAEELLNKFGKDRTLNILRGRENVQQLPVSPEIKQYFSGESTEKSFKKLRSKIYDHIMDLVERGLYEAVIRRLLSEKILVF